MWRGVATEPLSRANCARAFRICSSNRALPGDFHGWSPAGLAIARTGTLEPHSGRGAFIPFLLVDSEAIVQEKLQPPNPSGAWQHLAISDGWTRPRHSSDDQAQLMTTCMETWLMADHRVLEDYFSGLKMNRLLPAERLEWRRKEQIIQALKGATASSRKGKYDKGRDSFVLLGLVDPDQLERWLPARAFNHALISES